MAETVVSLALETIRDLLIEEIRFLSRVGAQVKEVETELQRMQCFLEDVDRRKHEEARVRNFVKEIRDLAYRIEEVVETYATKVPLKRQNRFRYSLRSFRNSLRIFCHTLGKPRRLHKVGSEIEEIKTAVVNLTASLDRYGIKAALEREKSGDAKNGTRKWLRQTFAHEIEEDFVGMKDDLRQLIARLFDDRRIYRIISICGMGGLGKTTLARKIFHHGDVRREFQAFAWVCVTQECKSKDVLRDILRQLLPETEKTKILSMGDRELVEELYKEQKEKKCLVVVDDIWKEEDWVSIRPAFPVAEGNSKVLLTTRKNDIAKVGFPYYPKFLTKDEGWELLQRKAFSKRELKDLRVEPNLVEDLGREMVHKCGYLPLAISVIGGILSEKDSLDAWEMVNKNIDLYMKRGKDNEGDGVIQQVLMLSYDDLPYNLKPCFLYLCHYPEDKKIDVEELYLLWIAEGIVSAKDQGKQETLIDVAERYLSELAGRSMLQVQVDLISMQFKSCQLHDLMRELCLQKASEEEFFHIMDFRGEKQSTRPPCFPTCVRRLGIYAYGPSNDSIVQDSAQKLRSLLFHSWDFESLMSKGLNDLGKLKFLRIVNFKNINFRGNNLTDEIGKLRCLRFLGFKFCYLEELASSICNLPLLQTLDLRGTHAQSSTVIIPNVLWKLKRLKHLYLNEMYGTEEGREKLQLQGLDELETLSGFQSENAEISGLYDLKNLKCLLDATVYGNESLLEIIDYMEDKTLNKISMRIMDCYLSSGEGFLLLRKVFMSQNICELDVTGVTICKLPKYEPNFCLSVKILRLSYCGIEEDPMETLEKLPKLRCLHLCQRSFLGKEMICHASGFRQLRELCLFDVPNWEKWRVEEGAMPCLLNLRISRCERLEMIPNELRSITTLQSLHIHRMPEEFLQRVRLGGEDYDKIHHINSVYVYNDY